MNIKSNRIVLAVIAVLSFVFAYLYDKWKYNAMWERCQATMWSQIAPRPENIPPKGVSFSDLICIFA